MAKPQSVEDWAAVDSLADFVEYLRLLSADFDRDQEEFAAQEARGFTFVEGDWRHPAILEAMCS
jgi:hypothetical protein